MALSLKKLLFIGSLLTAKKSRACNKWDLEVPVAQTPLETAWGTYERNL